MMRAAHNALGHRGAWATTQFLTKRFWWPDLEGDVAWYCRTCHICQLRTKMLLKIPPRVTETPSIFQVLHADVMNMTPASNGCKYIVHGRCALTSWAEGKPLREDSGPAIGAWLLDIITRWGCMKEIVTDNGGSFIRATAWLEKKYGIKGIKISPYNSKANGRVERPHYDIWDMLFKATGGKTKCIDCGDFECCCIPCTVMWGEEMKMEVGNGSTWINELLKRICFYNYY